MPLDHGKEVESLLYLMITQRRIRKRMNKNVGIVMHHQLRDFFLNTLIPTDRKKFLSCKENKQKLIELFSVYICILDDDLRQCLLFGHAISGCDTVSATFGMGKYGKASTKLKESSHWRSAMRKISDDDIRIDDMVALAKKFYIRRIYANTLDQVREIMYNLPKYILQELGGSPHQTCACGEKI